MSPRPDSPHEGGSLCPVSSVRKVGPALEHVVQVITCHFLQILGRESEKHLRKASLWLSEMLHIPIHSSKHVPSSLSFNTTL